MRTRFLIVALSCWAVALGLSLFWAGCGPSCVSGGQPLDAATLDLFRRVESCTKLFKAPPLELLTPTRASRQGNRRCIAGEHDLGDVTCPDGRSGCCAVGLWDECKTIIIPDEYRDGEAHEMIHYLLNSGDHGDPRESCQSLRRTTS